MAVVIFEDAWEVYKDDIRVNALSQYVPGLEPDDIASEMSICLWQATKTYRAGGSTTFGSYWWSIWLNRRSDIAASYHAIKRVHGIPTEVLPDRVHEDVLFPMPPDTDHLGNRVWGALAQGDTPKEVQHDNQISRRRYYSVIERFRTDDVRERLRS